MSQKSRSRRRFLLAVAAYSSGFALPVRSADAPKILPRLPVLQARSELLNFGYHDAGPEGGWPVILLHDLAYDIHSYAEVAQLLAAEGHRVIVPYLRGHGTTRFNDPATLRSGQQAAVGSDVIALMDVLHIPEAVIAGFGWGARAACIAAILKPMRCVGIVAANSYPVDDIVKADASSSAQALTNLSRQYYHFQTERGRVRLEADRRNVVRTLWKDNSPAWRFDDAVFSRAAQAFDNPDFVDVLIHSYRHRLGRVAGAAQYASVEEKLAGQALVAVPSISLEGTASGVLRATDTADRFRGAYSHQPVPGAGHDLPQEAPTVFAGAITELVRHSKWRT